MKTALRLGLARFLNVLLRMQSRPYPFPDGVALVVAPHADDETLGCGGLIAAKVLRRDPVLVAFVSDSAAGPDGDRPHGDRLATLRRREALDALRELGVPEQRVSFLDAPDGRLDRLEFGEARALQGKLVALLRAHSPREVFMPYLGGGSTEHDATVWLVREAVAVAGGRPQLWEYPVWAWWNPLRLGRQLARYEENFRLELGPLRPVKCTALAHHRSQVEPAPAPALPRALAEVCTGPVEYYFRRTL